MGTWRTLDVRGRSEEARAHAVVETAVQSGANLFDSSALYGEAERVLGDAVRAVRDRVLIATEEHIRHNALPSNPPWFGPEEREYVTRLATKASSIV